MKKSHKIKKIGIKQIPGQFLAILLVLILAFAASISAYALQAPENTTSAANKHNDDTELLNTADGQNDNAELLNTADEQNDNTVLLNTADSQKWEPVYDILVEKEYKLTNETVTFDGGYITDKTVPPIKNCYFREAYVEINSKQYPLEFLATINGQIHYAIQGSSTTVGEDKILATTIRTNEKITFSYLYPTDDSANNITYNITGVTQNELGATRVLNASQKIMDGQIVSFQVERIPGTEITVTTNGNNGIITNLTKNNSGFLYTYELSETTGDVTVNIQANWKKTTYNTKIISQVSGLSSPSWMWGDLYIGNGNTEQNKVLVQGIDGGTRLEDSHGKNEITLTMDHQVTMRDSLHDNTISYGYLLNTIRCSGGGFSYWHQQLFAISINDELVRIPITPTSDANQANDYPEITYTTVLEQGETKGTVVKVTRYANAIVEGGNDRYYGAHAYYPYRVEITNIHSDIETKLVYAPVGTQGILSMSFSSNVNPQIYVVPDWAGGTTGWTNWTANQYWYQKNSGGGNYKVRWKNRPGYINSWMEVDYNGTKRRYGTNPSGNQDVLVSKNNEGYYETDVGSSVQVGKYLVCSFGAEATKYTLKYDANGGEYARGTPIDPITYDSAVSNQIPLKNDIPHKDHAIFLGYKIEGNTTNTTFAPGTVIDLTDMSALNLADETQSELVLKAQWEDVTANSQLLEREVHTKKRTEDASYTDTIDKVLVANGSHYEIIRYPAEYDNGALVIDLSKSILSGMAGNEPIIASLVYEHPASLRYSQGNERNIQGALPPNEDKYAFDSVTLSGTKLTRTGFEHVGWMDNLTGQAYLFEDVNFAYEKTLPWDGLDLVPIWKNGDPEQQREAISANSFTLSIEEARQLTNQLLLERSAAKAWKADDPTSAIGITTITHTIEANIGSYDVTFATTNGTAITVKAIVTANNQIKESISANDFYLSLDEAGQITDQLLLERSGAKAWYTDNPDQPVDITTITHNIQIAQGVYNVTFTTANGTTTTVKAIVDDATWTRVSILANAFVLTVDEAGQITDQLLLERSGATAWYTDNPDQPVDITTITHTITAAVGTYDATFTTANGTTTTVKAIVIDNNQLKESIKASDFTLTVDEVKQLTDQLLLERSGAKAWYTDNPNQPVDITTITHTIHPVAGVYNVTFATAAGALTTVRATVIELPEPQPPINPENNGNTSGTIDMEAETISSNAYAQSPNTSDLSQISYLVAAMIVSGVLLVVIIKRKKSH